MADQGRQLQVGRTFAMSNSTSSTPPGDLGLVTVRGGATGLAQEIVIGNHRLTSDEPVAAGGTDSGPSPYDFLLAALGA
jgi:putative redox protein